MYKIVHMCRLEGCIPIRTVAFYFKKQTISIWFMQLQSLKGM